MQAIARTPMDFSRTSYFQNKLRGMVLDREKLVYDAVHGCISLESECVTFVDNPAFQRLRDLVQLGTSSFVYPGATHKRFEHCLGVAHLAGQSIAHIQAKQPGLRITDRDCMLVKIAGLCHDLGHGPFSHAFDGEFLPQALGPNCVWKHEHGSIMMLEYIIDDECIDVTREELRMLRKMICGDEGETKSIAKEEKPFLYDIVSNSRNSLDVDKFDYLQRDAYHIGFGGIEFSRLMLNSRVIDDEICFASKEVFNLYEVFHSRHYMHKQVYTHRVSKAVEYMIRDALLEANQVMKIADSIKDPEMYMRMTDSILYAIEYSQDARLSKARDIIARVRRRDLYKMASEAVLSYIPSDQVEPVDITTCQSGSLLVPDDIIVQCFTIDYSQRNSNPIDSVHFYSSQNRDLKFTIGSEQVSLLLPNKFSESYIRVFCRDPTVEKLAAAANALSVFLKTRGL